MDVAIILISSIAGFIVAYIVSNVLLKNISQKKIAEAENTAKNIVKDADNEARNIKKEKILEAKEEWHRRK